MIGQGRPHPSQDRCMPVAWKAAASAVQRAAIALLVLSAARAAPADDLRVRIAWGGGAERTWQGTISVSDGSISEPQPLGAEADEPGSMWLDGNPPSDHAALVVQQRSPRGYDGVDVSVSAAPTAKLLVHLSAADQRDRPATVEIPLADLSGEFVNKELDNQGNRLLVMRAPGDSLRVRFARESLVFAPGETFRFTLEPHGLPLPKGGSARIKIQLLGGGKELWSQEPDAQGRAGRAHSRRSGAAERRGRLRRRHYGGEQPEMVAGGPPAVQLEANDRRTARAIAGARSAASRGAKRCGVDASGRDRSGEPAMVRQVQQVAAVPVDQAAAADAEGAAGKRLFSDAAAPVGRVGGIESRTPIRPT